MFGNSPNSFGWLVVAIFASGIAGCGSGNDFPVALVEVSGVVTFKGKPVSGALVVFAPAVRGTPAAQGTTDNEGVYKLTTFDTDDGVAPGQYQILVTKKTMTNAMTAQESRDYFGKTGEAPPLPEFHNELPGRYSLQESTDLTVTVDESVANQIDLELTE